MNKRSLLMCACALAAMAASGCNESKEWSTAPTCGNAIIEVGEICDTSVPNSIGCAYYDASQTWLSGKPGCTTDCKLTQGTCVASSAVVGSCGNGVIDSGEVCDGANFNGKTCADFTGAGSTGELTCINCQINSSACKAAQGTPVCGNNVKEEGEACDGTDLGGSDCTTVYGEGATGSVSCTADCKSLDVTQCAGATESVCGDGKVEGNEKCDGDQFAELTGISCESVYGQNGAVSGAVKCDATCGLDYSDCKYCGDGIVNVDGEQCEGTVDAAVTCEQLTGISGATGTVKCSGLCRYDISDCKDPNTPETCGNDNIDAGEECDGSNLNGHTCEADVPGSTGTVSCDANCRIVTTACAEAPVCGDGVINGDDECEGTEFGGNTCETYKGAGATGDLVCNNCKIDSSACQAPAPAAGCDDGKLDAGEECDGSDFDGKTCDDYAGAGASGELSCVSCKIISSACKAAPKCGDGNLDSGEDCDKTVPATTTCDTHQAGYTGTVKCSSTCTFDFSDCKAPVVTPVCGNSKVETGEECDGSVPASVTCDAHQAGTTGTVKCTSCKYDYSDCKAASTGDYGKTYTIVFPGSNKANSAYATAIAGSANESSSVTYTGKSAIFDKYIQMTTNKSADNKVEITGFTGLGTVTVKMNGYSSDIDSNKFTYSVKSDSQEQKIKIADLHAIGGEVDTFVFDFNEESATSLTIIPTSTGSANKNRVAFYEVSFTAKK